MKSCLGEGVNARSVPHQTLPVREWKESHSIGTSPISTFNAMWFQDRRNVGRAERSPDDVIQGRVSGESAGTESTGQRMVPLGVGHRATPASVLGADIGTDSQRDGDAQGLLI